MKHVFIFSLILISCGITSQKSKSRDDVLIAKNIDSTSITAEIQEHVPFFSQIFVPFDVKHGVPFFESDVGHIVNGFEVDDDGNFYFVAACNDSTLIACFDGPQEIFRKSYKQFNPGKIHSYQDILYLYDEWVNNLFWLNQENGEIIRTLNSITDNRVNNHYFLDSLLLLNMYSINEQPSSGSNLISIAYDLEGLIWGVADSISTVSEISKTTINDTDFVGKWKGAYVYWEWGDVLSIVLKDARANNISSKEIDTDKLIEILYYDFPLDHVELAGNNIYHLSKKEDQAVITILSLEKLFPEL